MPAKRKSARPKAKTPSGKAGVVAKYSKSSGISKSTLNKVYSRGLGAYYSQGSRPGVSAHQWAAGRVRSVATGKGGGRKADADILKAKAGGRVRTYKKKKTTTRRKKR